MAQGPREISREEFERLYGRADPRAVEEVIGFAAGGEEFNRAYGELRRRGLSHEDATQGVQAILYGKVRSDRVGPENTANRVVAGLPLQGSAPANVADARAVLGIPEQINQLRLDLQGVTRSGGRFASPFKAAAWPEGVLAAAQSGRVMDQPQAVAAAPAGQLPLDYTGLQQVIDQVAGAPTPAAPSADGRDWKRMAGRYGLPALAALGAFAGLAALTGMDAPREPQEVS